MKHALPRCARRAVGVESSLPRNLGRCGQPGHHFFLPPPLAGTGGVGQRNETAVALIGSTVSVTVTATSAETAAFTAIPATSHPRDRDNSHSTTATVPVR